MKFCITFRDVYHKEFFSDYMANILLRKIYFVTLIPDLEKHRIKKDEPKIKETEV